MNRRLFVSCWVFSLTISTFAFTAQAQDFKALAQKTLEAWETLDPANAAPFYSQEPNRVFFDLAPLKYVGWAEYAEGVKKLFAEYESIKFTLADDAQISRRGNWALGILTVRVNAVRKNGAKEAMEARWTVVWERQGRDWIILHDHFSVPLTFPEPGQSLYKRLGGYDAIAAVVDDFIGRLANDPQLGRFFAGHSTGSLKRIRQLVVEQLCEATGGPCVYTGRDMKTSHAGLGISENNWQASVDHLVATLDKFKVPKKEQDEVLAAISGLKKDIVAPSAGGQK